MANQDDVRANARNIATEYSDTQFADLIATVVWINEKQAEYEIGSNDADLIYKLCVAQLEVLLPKVTNRLSSLKKELPSPSLDESFDVP